MEFLNSYTIKNLEILQTYFNIPKTRLSKQKLIDLLSTHITNNNIIEEQINIILDSRLNNIVYNYIDNKSVNDLISIHNSMELPNTESLKKKSELINSLMNIIPNHLSTHDDIDKFINNYTYQPDIIHHSNKDDISIVIIDELIEPIKSYIDEPEQIVNTEPEQIVNTEAEQIVNIKAEQIVNTEAEQINECKRLKQEYKNNIHSINNIIDKLNDDIDTLSKNEFELKIQKLNKSKLVLIDSIIDVSIIDVNKLNKELIDIREQISIKLNELSNVGKDINNQKVIIDSLKSKLVTVKYTESVIMDKLKSQSYDYQKLKTEILEKIANKTLTVSDSESIKKLLTDDDYKVMLENVLNNNKVQDQIDKLMSNMKTTIDLKSNLKNEVDDYNKLLINKINDIYQNNNNIAISIRNNKLNTLINKINDDIAENYDKLNMVNELLKNKNDDITKYRSLIDDLLKKIYTADAIINSKTN